MENGKSGMRNAEWGMGNEQEGTAEDGCRTGDGACEVTSGGCGDGENGEPTPEVSQSPIVGYDSNHVIDDSTNDKIGILSHEGMTNDKIGILSHEGMDARDQPGQGDGAGQCLVESKIENPKSKISVCQGGCDPQSLTSSVKTPENVQNEANLESTQSSLLLEVESYLPEPAGRKRSHL